MDRRTGYTMSNPFWDYSLATYTSGRGGGDLSGAAGHLRPGCEPVAVRSVAGTHGPASQRLSIWPQWRREIVDWRGRVVEPLRALRRQLQGYYPAQGIRDEIKTLELRAEQQQQDMMWACFQRTAGLPRTPRPLRENLAAGSAVRQPEGCGMGTYPWIVWSHCSRCEAGVAPGRGG